MAKDVADLLASAVETGRSLQNPSDRLVLYIGGGESNPTTQCCTQIRCSAHVTPKYPSLYAIHVSLCNYVTVSLCNCHRRWGAYSRSWGTSARPPSLPGRWRRCTSSRSRGSRPSAPRRSSRSPPPPTKCSRLPPSRLPRRRYATPPPLYCIATVLYCHCTVLLLYRIATVLCCYCTVLLLYCVAATILLPLYFCHCNSTSVLIPLYRYHCTVLLPLYLCHCKLLLS